MGQMTLLHEDACINVINSGAIHTGTLRNLAINLKTENWVTTAIFKSHVPASGKHVEQP